jgi:hypothetical protein
MRDRRPDTSPMAHRSVVDGHDFCIIAPSLLRSFRSSEKSSKPGSNNVHRDTRSFSPNVSPKLHRLRVGTIIMTRRYIALMRLTSSSLGARPRKELRARVLRALSPDPDRPSESPVASGLIRCGFPLSAGRPLDWPSGEGAGRRRAGPGRSFTLPHDPGRIPTRDLIRRPFQTGGLERRDGHG